MFVGKVSQAEIKSYNRTDHCYILMIEMSSSDCNVEKAKDYIEDLTSAEFEEAFRRYQEFLHSQEGVK